MKTLRVFLLLVVTLLAQGARSQGYRWENLSPAKAIQAIRDFENDPTLKLTFTKPMDSGTSEPDMFAENYLYCLSSGRHQYTVSKYTHTRITRSDNLFFFHREDGNFYGQRYDPVVLKQQVMSQAAAVNIARDYMQAHYPKPEALNVMSVREAGGEDQTLVNGALPPYFTQVYQVNYSQDCGGGIRGPSFCCVEVDAILGQVVSYIQIYYPIMIPIAPRLSSAQAMNFAMNSLLTAPGGEPSKVHNLFVSRPDAMGRQTMMYDLSFWGDINGVNAEHTVTIDAFNGRVYSRSIIQSVHEAKKVTGLTPSEPSFVFTARKKAVVFPSLDAAFNGQTAKLLNPPLLVDGQPYLYVGYLCYGAKDVKLRYNGRDDIAIVSPKRAARFSLHKAEYTLNGHTRALPARPVIVEDRCYVPLRAAQDTMPFSIAYDAAKKQVRFDALPAAVKTAKTNAPKEEVVFGGKR